MWAKNELAGSIPRGEQKKNDYLNSFKMHKK